MGLGLGLGLGPGLGIGIGLGLELLLLLVAVSAICDGLERVELVERGVESGSGVGVSVVLSVGCLSELGEAS